MGILGHEQEGPSQRGGCGVGPRGKEVQNCDEEVVVVEVTLGPGLLQVPGGVKEKLQKKNWMWIIDASL